MHLQKRLQPLLICSITLLFAGNIRAADSPSDIVLPLDARILDNGNTIELEWPRATSRNVDPAIIQRRILGSSGISSWHTIGTARQNATRYKDDDLEPGIAYEYRVSRYGSTQTETGYWVAGTLIPAEEKRGTALVIVDETLSEALALHLDRFEMDLVADGWAVVRHEVPRHRGGPVVNLQSARAIQAWIREQFSASPDTPHTLILVGNVPVVKSGRTNPDGHNARPLETDLFYADADGEWQSNDGGQLQHNVIPGDHIEMQVGRIDFSNMSAGQEDELSLLKQYFDKNHNWRHDLQGDLRQAYGGHAMLSVENAALRNIVGPDDITKGGHHDAGTRQAWLLGIDFGDWNAGKYFTAEPINAVFSINFGSSKLEFSSHSAMKAMLAQPWYGLATGWGGRPSWQLHHMALGKSIGYSHMRTVNNGAISRGGEFSLEYIPTGEYPWVNPVWINLLGDPTLHAFPLGPVKNLQAQPVAEGVQLSWEAAEPGVQYRVYRAQDRLGPYTPLNASALLDDTQYLDANATPGAWYMVRAHGLKEVYAGSFHTYSQGVFATVGNAPPVATDQRLATVAGQDLMVLPLATDADVGDNLLMAVIRGPENGQLSRSADGWVYHPAPEFTGEVTIPFTVFDGTTSNEAVITVHVTAE